MKNNISILFLICSLNLPYCLVTAQLWSIDGPKVICPGQSYLLEPTRSFVKYKWSTGDTSSRIIISNGGEYCVTVSDAAGLKDSSCIFISELSLTPLTIISDSVFCQGRSHILEANSGFLEYIWNDSISGRQLKITQPGTYCVEVLNVNGCRSEKCINIRQKNWNYERRDITICYGDTVEFNKFYLTDTGKYTFKFAKSNGCDSIFEYYIKHFDRISFASIVIQKQSGFKIDPLMKGGVGPLKYYWSNGDTNRILLTSLEGNYTLEVIDSVGCKVDTTISLYRIGIFEESNIIELIREKNYLSYDDFEKLINSILQIAPNIKIEVFDLNGKYILSGRNINQFKLPNSAWYLLNISDEFGRKISWKIFIF
ncbi:MAG: hypothetical protein IPL98_06155 [Saprospiraceae bacterium]|nr:hypothetical protein [Saprospiraceae bacterium]